MKRTLFGKQILALVTLVMLMTVWLPVGIFATTSTPQTPQGSGSVYVTGYTVLNSQGAEVQRISTGEKCQIVVALRDGRLSNVPQTDGNGNIVNIKLTSTKNFASPSFGDIKQTTPTPVNGELSYAIIFNDITYLGGSNEISFDISYIDDSLSLPLQNVSVGISQCYDVTQSAASKPNIMVQNINLGATSINAGDNFILNLTSYNTSKAIGVYDVVTSISLPSTLTLASGSNVIMTSKVAAGGTFDNGFALQALSSAETGVANVTVSYTYYLEGTDTQLSSSQVITVPIVQPDRFSFTTVDLPTDLYAGQEDILTVNYVNKGKGTLYNLTAEIGGNINEPGQIQYLGNLNSGAQGSADFSIVALEAGTVSGMITLTYEDVNGQEKKATYDYNLTAQEAYVPNPGDIIDPGIDPVLPQEKKGMPVWGWALIIVGGVVVLVVVIKIVKKRKAKKLAELLSEDEEDEDF